MDGSNPYFPHVQIMSRIHPTSNKALIDEVKNQTKVIDKEVEQTQI